MLILLGVLTSPIWVPIVAIVAPIAGAIGLAGALPVS